MAEVVLPLASVTVTVAPVSAVPMATVPVIEVAAAVVGWLDVDEGELEPPPHAARENVNEAHSASCAIPVVYRSFMLMVLVAE